MPRNAWRRVKWSWVVEDSGAEVRIGESLIPIVRRGILREEEEHEERTEGGKFLVEYVH